MASRCDRFSSLAFCANFQNFLSRGIISRIFLGDDFLTNGSWLAAVASQRSPPVQIMARRLCRRSCNFVPDLTQSGFRGTIFCDVPSPCNALKVI